MTWLDRKRGYALCYRFKPNEKWKRCAGNLASGLCRDNDGRAYVVFRIVDGKREMFTKFLLESAATDAVIIETYAYRSEEALHLASERPLWRVSIGMETTMLELERDGIFTQAEGEGLL